MRVSIVVLFLYDHPIIHKFVVVVVFVVCCCVVLVLAGEKYKRVYKPQINKANRFKDAEVIYRVEEQIERRLRVKKIRRLAERLSSDSQFETFYLAHIRSNLLCL